MSSARRKGFRRRSEIENPKKFVVIAMEGKETEPRYFSEFRTPREAEIQIKLVPNPNHKSKPKAVLKRLTHFYRDYSHAKGDQGWLVIDRDAWTEEELIEVHREAKKAGFHVAMSNPCFELWLYLHLRDSRPFYDRHDCQRGLTELVAGYCPERKGDYDVSALLTGMEEAIVRAKSLDTGSQESWPQNQATRVYMLVETILGRGI